VDSRTFLNLYKMKNHFAWVTKYRYKVLMGDVTKRVSEGYFYAIAG